MGIPWGEVTGSERELFELYIVSEKSQTSSFQPRCSIDFFTLLKKLGTSILGCL
jgi:hypothetical protein